MKNVVMYIGDYFDDSDFIISKLEEAYRDTPFKKLWTLNPNEEKNFWENIDNWASNKGVDHRVYDIATNVEEEYPADMMISFPSFAKIDVTFPYLPGLSRIHYDRLIFRKEDKNTWFLSNFAAMPFVADGVEWKTSEHYYQAQKAFDDEGKEKIRKIRTPNASKKMANSMITKKSNWDEIKYDVMMNTLRHKFYEGSEAAQLLLDTGQKYLIEYAPWGDSCWGAYFVGDRLVGQNNLGKLLMKRRDELRGKK